MKIETKRIETLFQQGILGGTVSQRKKTAAAAHTKVEIKPFMQDGACKYQFTYTYGKQVKHQNFTQEEAVEQVTALLDIDYHQCSLYTKEADYALTCFAKLKIKTLAPTHADREVDLSHNKTKQYIIPEGEPCDFLVCLGVMSERGDVYKNKYDKFRQINKYLEFVAETIGVFDEGKSIHIVDFGCGKSYLTFALYYYLVRVLGKDVKITGLDLKEDVIAFCEKTARHLHYEGLHFEMGNINGYHSEIPIDMVVTLHACDTATDYALAQAVDWGAKVILTVPCCQHELLTQIDNAQMKPLLCHGVLKEKLSSLVTDAIRGQLLEAWGYRVNTMEFIDMEHTPKNVLIKAIKKGGFDQNAYQTYLDFAAFWNVKPTLAELLQK